MKTMKTAVVYFSATNVTRSCAEAIHGELIRRGADSALVDVTPFSARSDPPPFREYGGLIFGAPVYGDFPPSVFADWLPTLAGEGKPCATFVTYGGRTPGYALYHMYELLREAGFRVRLSAEFPGRHTFNLAGWNMLPDRPDERDFETAREFAALALRRFDPGNRDAFSLQKPFGYDASIRMRREPPPSAERRWAQPVRVKECSLCGLCEAECPARAMDAQSGESDPAKCIECLHCVYICPEGALRTDDRLGPFYPEFLKEFGITEDILRHKQSRIIAAPWDTAA
jgi:ferredoxin/flavodoxin